jgi:hypothetical protein
MTEEERFFKWYGEFLVKHEVDELTARSAYDAARRPDTITSYIGEGRGIAFTSSLRTRPFVPVSR